MEIRQVGVDLAKNVFQLHGANIRGKAVWKRKLSREKWIESVCKTVPKGCEIGMEACGSAHYWARRLTELGYQVKLISPQFVKPFVKSNKNDANDAEAICEAMSRPSMRFVKVKSIEQQDIQAVHRIRSELITQRTAKVNQIRGLAAEYGLVTTQKISSLRESLPCWLEDAENGLTDRFRTLLRGLWDDLNYLDCRISKLDSEIQDIAKHNPLAKRLQQLRGVGPLIATALIAAVGNGDQFTKGRQMAASVGLTPRQFSSDGKERLLGMSKRGDAYLRTILIHGARSTVARAKNHDDRLSIWITDLAKRRHPNIAAVALANKTVRMAWAMMHSDSDYDPEIAVAKVAMAL